MKLGVTNENNVNNVKAVYSVSWFS